MNSREQFIEEQKEYHISVWLQTELGYDDDQIDLFWSNIGGLIDIDLQEWGGRLCIDDLTRIFSKRFFTND